LEQPLRAAIYARVSTDEQARDGTSLDTQRSRCRAFIASKGWALAGEFVDEGVSGSRDSRPELDRLLAAARRSDIQVIVVSKLDRFFRSTRHFLNAVAELDDIGVAFVSLAESIDGSTPTGRFSRTTLSAVAELEREMIRDRMTSGRRSVAEGGYWPGGPPPYGFRMLNDGPRTRLAIDESEAQVIRRAVDLIVDQGCSTWEAAQRLNALGFTPRHANRWEHNNLRRALLSETLAGTTTWAKPGRWTKHNEPVVIEIPLLIAAERRAALVVALRASGTGPRTSNRAYPLTGRLVGLCGATYHGLWRKDRQTRWYRCSNARAEAADRCRDRWLSADGIEDAAWVAVCELLTEPSRLLSMAQDYLGLRSSQLEVERDTLEAVEAQITKHELALTNTVTDYIKAGVNPELMRRATTTLERELEALRRHRADLIAWRCESANESERMRQLWELADLAHTRLRTMGVSGRASVFRLLGVQVTVLEHRSSRYGTTKVRIEGRVHHELLIDRVQSGELSSAVSRNLARKVTGEGLPFSLELAVA